VVSDATVIDGHSVRARSRPEPGFARREAKDADFHEQRRRRGSVGEPRVPPRGEILSVLRERIGRPTDDELETALDELVSIAVSRWERE
jgi:hypothetical protein